MTKEQLKEFGIIVEKDEVTEEEALALIKKHTQDLANEKTKLKGQVDKYSSEIATFKDKEKARMSEEEKRVLAEQELQKELSDLRRENAINKKVAEYTGIGYSKELALKVAEAELDGKSTAKFHQEFITSREETLKAELLGKTPRPKEIPNDPNEKFTKENFAKGLITMAEMNELKVTNPAKYNEILGIK